MFGKHITIAGTATVFSFRQCLYYKATCATGVNVRYSLIAVTRFLPNTDM